NEFDCVILIDKDISFCLEINKLTHNSFTKFILATTLGLTGRIFSDFGENFNVKDTDGEPEIFTNVDEVVEINDELFFICHNSEKFFQNLCIGDYVKFSLIKNETFQVKYITKNSFSINYNKNQIDKQFINYLN